jgi:SAM-dependent methyltransferase
VKLRRIAWRRRLRELFRSRGERTAEPSDWPEAVPKVRWFDNREDYRRYLEPGRSERRAREQDVSRQAMWRGLCSYCRAARDFTVSAGAWLGENVNLREGLVCPGCGLGNRLRLLFKAVEDFAGSPGQLRQRRAYVAERVTTFYQRLADRIDDVVGSEYLDASCVPGETRVVASQSVRHEDLCRLSFSDESFDLVIHADVLEHVPDYRRAFIELHRVTRRGGGMFFSVPFLHDRDEDEVRASIQADGSIVHHLPAVYHGNPVDPKGALAFRTYGWSMLDTLRGVGFDTAQAGVLVDLDLGFASSNSPGEDFMEPVVFRALRGIAGGVNGRPGRATQGHPRGASAAT